jgi:hypothetical protein
MEAMGFMAGCGFPTPEYCNPSDFLLKIISASAKEKEISADCQEMKICDDFELRHQPYQDLIAEVKNAQPVGDLAMVDASSTNATFLSMTYTLILRSWLGVYRDPLATTARLAQTLIFGFQVGLLYLDVDNSQQDVQGINGSMFFLLVNGMFVAFNSTVISFPLEKGLVIREVKNGYYPLLAYLASRSLADLPFQALYPFIGSFVYGLVRYTHSWSSYFKWTLTMVLLGNSAASFGMIASAIAPDVTVATNLAPLFVLPLMLVGGYFG